MHRIVEIRRASRIHAEKLRRRDSHHCERKVVDQNGLSDGPGGISEMPLRESVTGDGHGWSARPVVVWNDRPPRRGNDPEPAEIVARNAPPASNLGQPTNAGLYR